MPASASTRIRKHVKCQSDSNCNDHDPCTISKFINKYRCEDSARSFSEILSDFCGTKTMMNSANNKSLNYFL